MQFTEFIKKIISLLILFSVLALATLALDSTASADAEADAIRKATASPELSGFASVEASRMDLGSLGQVLGVDGAASVMRTKGNIDKLEHDTLLFAGDRVQLTENARAVIRLSDARFERSQSVVTLLGNTILVILEAKADGPENLRDVQLVMESGDVRAQVPPSSDPVLPTFHVRLPTSQVNLKSGDVWIHLEHSSGQLHSRVSMLDGKSTLLTERAVDGKKDYVDIGLHQTAEFVQLEIPAGATVGSFQKLVDRGDFTEPVAIEASDIAKIAKSSDVLSDMQKHQADAFKSAKMKTIEVAKSKKIQAAKKMAVKEAREAATHLCQAPGGQFNQCAWTCTGKNPKQAKTCRTDLEGVACVRTICRADGEWKEETRVPASQSDFCPAKGSTVHDCGNYW